MRKGVKGEKNMAEYNWPSPDEFGETETIDAEILVLGGGLAGCFAAIAVARKGEKVVLVEKGATKRSGGGAVITIASALLLVL